MFYEAPIFIVTGKASELLKGPPHPGPDGDVVSGITPAQNVVED